MSKRPIIIDCDPGQDDAINLMLALAPNDELDVLGITTVAGNVPLALTQRNARLIAELCGADDAGVYAGCERPMVRDLVTAEKVHGKTGIDGIAIYEPQRPLRPAHAVDFIVDTLRASAEHSVTLVPVGPLTNIAMALVKAPDIVDYIDEIVLMGGAMREGGNHSPSAEFNIFVDPHAAHVVFGCGRPITAVGLDASHQVLATRERVHALRALGNPVADAACDMLEFFNRFDSEKYGTGGAPLHDPCTVAYLLQPELFSGKDCNVTVDIWSPVTLGHTAVDFWHVTDRRPNVNWIHRVDADGFYSLLTERLARFG